MAALLDDAGACAAVISLVPGARRPEPVCP